MLDVDIGGWALRQGARLRTPAGKRALDAEVWGGAHGAGVASMFRGPANLREH
jgi:hypothetical protein